MLAITGLPAVGDRGGSPIVLATDGLTPNALTIVLDNVTNPGKVTATINGNAYFNFGNSISFTGTFDTDGTIDNQVTLITPFGVDLAKGVNPFEWNPTCDFTPAGLTDVSVKLTNADALAIRTTLGGSGGPSSITGVFHSPTLAPPPGATIDFQSSSVITVLAAGVETNGLTLTTTVNGAPTGIVFQGQAKANASLKVSSATDIVIDQQLVSGGSILITSTNGSVFANKAITGATDVTLTADQDVDVNDVITSLTGTIGLTATDGFVTVDADVAADLGVTVAGNNGITTDTAADIEVAAGPVSLTSSGGFVTVLGGTKINGNGALTLNSIGDLTLGGETTLLGTGNMKASSAAGNLAVQTLSPISVTNGTIELQAVAGALDIQAKVAANQTVTLQAAQGISLSNAVDPDAGLWATGPGGGVTVTNSANRILIDAPVTSQAGAVTITAAINDIDVRDDVFGQDTVKIAANAALVFNGVAPSINAKSNLGILDLSSTTDSVTVGPNVAIGIGVGATAGVTVTAATAVTLLVPIVANGAITIASPDGFASQSALTSNQGAITITAASGSVTSVLHAVTGSEIVMITAEGDITLDSTITSTKAGIAITSVAGTITTQAGSVLSAPSLTAGAISLDAGRFLMGNDITAGTDITVQTVTAFFSPAVFKNFTSLAGDISIEVTESDLDVSGSFLSAALGSVTLAAAGTVDYGTVLTGPTGDFSVTGGGAVTPLGPINAGGSITISTGGTYLPGVGADLFAVTGSISVKASGAVDVSGITVNAPLGSISLTSRTSDVTVGAAPNLLAVSLVDGSITLAAPMGTVAVGQVLTAGKHIEISSLGAFLSAFSLTATTGDISVATTGLGGSIKFNDVATAGNDIKLNTVGVDAFIETLGTTAGNDIRLTTGGVDAFIKVFSATTGNDIAFTTAGSGAEIVVDDALTADNDITLVTAGTDAFIQVFAALSGNDIAFTTAGSGAEIAVDDALTADNDITLVTAGTGGFIDVSNPATLIMPVAGDITLTSLADAVLLATGNPLFSAAGNIAVSSSFTLDVLTQVTALLGNVTLASTAGDVFIKEAVFADPMTGTLSISAAGEINDGTPNGAVTKEVTAGSLVTTAGPLGTPTVFPQLRFTNPLNSVGDLSISLTRGAGVEFVNNGTFTVSALSNDTGAVRLESKAGGIGILVSIGTGATETLANVTLTAVDDIVVNGTIQSTTGSIALTATNGDISVTGGLNATTGLDVAVKTTTGSIAITGNINSNQGIDLDAGNKITLGVSSSAITVSTVTKTIRLDAGGDVDVIGATVSAPVGSIVMTTPTALSFDGGLLESALTYSNPPAPSPVEGLVSLEGLGGISVATSPVVRAGRLEIIGGGGGAIRFDSPLNDVDTLQVEAGGNFTYYQELVPLSIDDPDDLANATVQVKSTGGSVSITSTAGLRIVDGLQYNTTLLLVGRTTGINPGVEFVVTSGSDNPSPPSLAPPFAFAGTLRDMLTYCNANTATNGGTGNTPMRVVFNDVRSPATVTLGDTLPQVVKSITFDGVLNGGGRVGIDGSSIASPSANGISLGAGSGGSLVQNAYVYGFGNAAVQATSGRNVFRGLTLGADDTGTAVGNGIGILLTGPLAVQNVVGIQNAGDVGNAIVNNRRGLVIFNRANYTSVYGNTISDNVGPGTTDGDGISVVSSLGTRIGSDASGLLANTISDNGRHGVYLENVQGSSTAYGAVIQGNNITDNDFSGVQITGGGRNLVGGTTLLARNEISGNLDGVQTVRSLLPLPSNSNQILGNRFTGNTRSGVNVAAGFANMVSRNEFSGNGDHGVWIANATATRQQPANVVIGNTFANDGTTENEGAIVIQNSKGQLVGVDAARRVFGNTVANDPTRGSGSGIVVLGNAAHTLNVVQGNTVSGGRFDGIRVVGAAATTVSGNTVSANAASGISVVDSLATSTAGNRVLANRSSGNTVGIRVAGSRFTQVGGTLVADGNYVFSNTSDGIVVNGSTNYPASEGTVVRNNVVGVAPGNAPAGNSGYGIRLSAAMNTTVDYRNQVRNNTGGGIQVVGGIGTTIGGGISGRGNTIAGNQGDGVRVDQPASGTQPVNVTIAGNTIESNGGNGVNVTGARTSTVTIGRAPSIGVPNGTGNMIRANGGAGIRADAAQIVTMIGNSFSTNVDAPIQLLNGANSGILAPAGLVATQRPGNPKAPQFEIRGTVPVVPGRSLGESVYVDVYMDTASGGQFFMGRVLARTGASFRVILSGPAASGLGRTAIRATATGTGGGLFGDTSAFSAYAT